MVGPIPLATQLQERKLCLDESFLQEAVTAIDQGDQKGAGEEHSSWKDGKKHPSQQGDITFNCKLFSLSYSSCPAATKLKPEYFPQTYAGGILAWLQIKLVGINVLLNKNPRSNNN